MHACIKAETQCIDDLYLLANNFQAITRRHKVEKTDGTGIVAYLPTRSSQVGPTGEFKGQMC